jgi:hypothetical protein
MSNTSQQDQAVMIYTTYPSVVEAEEAGRARWSSGGFAPA